MKKFAISTILATTVIMSGYSFVQAAESSNGDAAKMESSQDGKHGMHHKRGPIDLERYSSRVEKIKAADADDDGTISREELEDYAMQMMVKRMADRMERRLDVDGDGTIKIADLEDQKEKEFAALDRDGDGKLDRREMRSGPKFGGKGGKAWHRDGPRGHHFRHH